MSNRQPNQGRVLRQFKRDDSVSEMYGGAPTNTRQQSGRQNGGKKRRNRNNQQGGQDLSSMHRAGGALTIKHKKKPERRSHSQGGSEIPQKRRYYCKCQGTEHPVIINCLGCGNIVCEEQGEGECFFCGEIVEKNRTVMQDVVSELSEREQKEVREAKRKLKMAIDQQEHILEQQRTSEGRQIVFDDQGDFFEDDIWLDTQERQEVQERIKKERELAAIPRSQRRIKIAIDLEKQEISQREDDMFWGDYSKVETKSFAKKEQKMPKIDISNLPFQPTRFFQNNALNGRAQEVYDQLTAIAKSEAKKSKKITERKLNDNSIDEETKQHLIGGLDRGSGRLQDDNIFGPKAILEKSSRPVAKHARVKSYALDENSGEQDSPYGDVTDEGVALSMHQPWASLLVYGIKRAEGRSWSTEHRGRLWIAAAKRQPTKLEIDQVEKQYCETYGLEHSEIPFPSEYPTSALLGCVDVNDCLTNEEYSQQDRSEENGSLHIFMCSHPRILLVPSPIKGGHKLWRLQRGELKPAQQALRKVSLSWIKQS